MGVNRPTMDGRMARETTGEHDASATAVGSGDCTVLYYMG